MDIKKILHKEKENDGKTIHLYYEPRLDSWFALLKSAYALTLNLKKLGIDDTERQGLLLNVPLLVVGEETLGKLREKLPNRLEKRNRHCRLTSNQDFDEKEYEEWMNRFLETETIEGAPEDMTPVGHLLPKDEFIPDPKSSISKGVKRGLDFFFSGISMMVFSPLFLACYLAIKFEDKGPAIYRQERIGRYGQPFYILKFRSMIVNAEKSGPKLSHSSGESDERLTKVGRFIRAHHLDELPQLWNVFVGDMSFVGPRPERQFFIDQIMKYDRRYPYLYQIRPGVTSYATLYNGYTDTIEKMLKRLEYDLYYLSNNSLGFDSKVLLNTFLSILTGKKF